MPPPRRQYDFVGAQLESEKGIDLEFFADLVRESTVRLHELLRAKKREGSTVSIYGASTRGVTIVNAACLDESLIYQAADRDPSKRGMLFPGTRIPIVSDEQMREAAPDYLLALPYSYMEQFRRREAEWLHNGGRFIVPVPIPRVV